MCYTCVEENPWSHRGIRLYGDTDNTAYLLSNPLRGYLTPSVININAQAMFQSQASKLNVRDERQKMWRTCIIGCSHFVHIAWHVKVYKSRERKKTTKRQYNSWVLLFWLTTPYKLKQICFSDQFQWLVNLICLATAKARQNISSFTRHKDNDQKGSSGEQYEHETENVGQISHCIRSVRQFITSRVWTPSYRL